MDTVLYLLWPCAGYSIHMSIRMCQYHKLVSEVGCQLIMPKRSTTLCSSEQLSLPGTIHRKSRQFTIGVRGDV